MKADILLRGTRTTSATKYKSRAMLRSFVIQFAVLAAVLSPAASRAPTLARLSPFAAHAANNTIACSSPVSNAIFVASQHVATIINTATNSISVQSPYPFDSATSYILLCMGMGLDASGFDVYLVGYTDSSWSNPYVAFFRSSSPPEWNMYTLPPAFNALGGYAIDFHSSRLWLTTARSVRMLQYALGSRGSNVTITELSSVATVDNDTWYLRFIAATRQLFVVSTDLHTYSRITEIVLHPNNDMTLLTNYSAVVPAPLPYYFAPTCTKEGCSLSQANQSPRAFVIATNSHVFTVSYSRGDMFSWRPSDVLVLPRPASQQGCSCPVTGFMFLGDVSGRWACVDTLVLPARIVNSDFVGSSWPGPKAPSMMGGQGPWVDFAHACAIDGGKVFLAGVYSFGSEASVSNAVGILDIPITFPPNWLTPTMIAIISVASALHIINFAAVVTFTRRRGYSRVLLWSVAAVFFSVLVWLPLLAAPPPSSTSRVRHEAEEQLLLSSAQHQKLTANFNKEVSGA